MTNVSLMPIYSINTLSDQSIGTILAAIVGGSAPASAAWPAANDAIFVPFLITQPILVKRLFVMNGNTATGNIDMGVYTDDGSRIVSSGSLLQSGTNVPQYFNVTDFVLTPGNYYFAEAMSNVTGTSGRINISVSRSRTFGILKATGSFALPPTVTFTTVTSGLIPMVGIEVMGLY